MPMAGGIANMGYQCGMLWGAALAAGAQAYRLFGSGPQAETEAILAAQRLLEAFRARAKGEMNCLEISHINMQEKNGLLEILKFFAKGGPIGCLSLTARYAPAVRSEIDSVFSKDHHDSPASPVSCATLLAKKIGASEMHAVMAAGFAGGAAIWLIGLSRPVEIEGISYSGTWVNDTIEKFLKITDYEFECSKIIGRKFEDVSEHADYLCNGGCSEIIAALASA